MPLPSANDVHVDALRTDMSIAYVQSNDAFVANKAFPVVPVNEQSAKYAVWDKNDFMRRQMRKIADGDPAPEMKYGVDTNNTYFCETYGGKKFVTDRQKANTDKPLDLDRTTVKFCTQQALIERDYQFAQAAFTTSVWATDKTPNTTWEDSSGTPIEDLRLGISTIRNSIGRDPNLLILGTDVWDELQDHSDLLDRIKHTQTGVMTEELLANILGIDRVVVGRGVYSTGSDGGSTSMSNIFDPDDALLLYVTDSPAMDEPSAGYTFSWTEFDEVKEVAENGAAAIKTWREDDPDGEWFRAMMSFDVVATATDAGYFFDECVA